MALSYFLNLLISKRGENEKRSLEKEKKKKKTKKAFLP